MYIKVYIGACECLDVALGGMQGGFLKIIREVC